MYLRLWPFAVVKLPPMYTVPLGATATALEKLFRFGAKPVRFPVLMS